MKKFFDTGMPNVVSNVNQIKISRRYKNNASEFILPRFCYYWSITFRNI